VVDFTTGKFAHGFKKKKKLRFHQLETVLIALMTNFLAGLQLPIGLHAAPDPAQMKSPRQVL
jgi:hypothetical protein